MPRQYLDINPTFSPSRHGLLSALSDAITTPDDPHWTAGVTYEVLCPAGGTTYDECLVVSGTGQAPVPPPPTKSDTGGGLVRRGATAFTVYAQVDCSAPGFWDSAPQVVRDSLARVEGRQVEAALWTGTAANAQVVFPRLAADAEVVDADSGALMQPQAIDVTGDGGALDVVRGVGALESALAGCYDGVGVIHVPVDLYPALAEAGLLVRDGSRYRTPLGSLVVIGPGYPGTAPDGSAPAAGTTYAYATGALTVLRGEPTLMPRSSTLDRATNTVHGIAERTYLVTWDCPCLLAVNVSLSRCCAGGEQP